MGNSTMWMGTQSISHHTERSMVDQSAHSKGLSINGRGLPARLAAAQSTDPTTGIHDFSLARCFRPLLSVDIAHSRSRRGEQRAILRALVRNVGHSVLLSPGLDRGSTEAGRRPSHHSSIQRESRPLRQEYCAAHLRLRCPGGEWSC